jgi:hypothetical protein
VSDRTTVYLGGVSIGAAPSGLKGVTVRVLLLAVSVVLWWACAVSAVPLDAL